MTKKSKKYLHKKGIIFTFILTNVNQAFISIVEIYLN